MVENAHNVYIALFHIFEVSSVWLMAINNLLWRSLGVGEERGRGMWSNASFFVELEVFF